jgi:hypothetical protein
MCDSYNMCFVASREGKAKESYNHTPREGIFDTVQQTKIDKQHERAEHSKYHLRLCPRAERSANIMCQPRGLDLRSLAAR